MLTSQDEVVVVRKAWVSSGSPGLSLLYRVMIIAESAGERAQFMAIHLRLSNLSV